MKLNILVVAALLGASCSQQAKPTFQRPDDVVPPTVYTVATDILPDAMQVLQQGGYAVLGTAAKGESRLVKLYVVSADGKPLWNKEFTGSGTSLFGKALCLLPDGNLLLAGDSRMADQSLAGWLCKIDLQGNVIWEKTDPLFNTVDEIAVTPAGQVAVLHNISNMSISLLSSDGSVLWTTSVDEQVYTGRHLFTLRDGGFAASSKILSEGEVNHHLKLYRLKADGSLAWAKEMKQCPESSVIGMYESPAGELVFAGTRQDTIEKNGVYWLKTDGTGNLLADSATWWEDDVAEPSKAISNSQGNLFFAGQMQNFKRPYRVFVGSFAANGQLAWTRTISDENAWQSAEDLALLPDGRLALLAYASVKGKNGEQGTGSCTIRIMPGNGGVGIAVNY